ncbi:MAG: hypothetical protein ACR2RF_08665, partial [Geminicoccaceae bacterium]
QRPVHSAHVGQELEVYYRWHPYFGNRVLVRQIQERADGCYVRVEGTGGIVVLMAAWMLDPVACATMTVGPPRVEWATLVELCQHLLDVRPSEASSKEAIIVREERDEESEEAGTADGVTPVEPDVRRHANGRAGRSRATEGCVSTGSDSDAGRRLGCRGVRR